MPTGSFPNGGRTYQRAAKVIAYAVVIGTIFGVASSPTYAQKGGGTTPPANPEIVFASSGIKVMNADGTNVRTVVSLARGDGASNPCWGPTGTNIVFQGGFGGVAGIYTVNLDGTNRQLVVPGTDSTPKWSRQAGPNGQHLIALVGIGEGGRQDIFVVNPNGTGRLNVTASPNANEYYCAWARNGYQLYFVRNNTLMLATLGLDANGQVIKTAEELVWTSPAGVSMVDIETANTSEAIVFRSGSQTPGRIAILDLSTPTPTMSLVTASSTTDEKWPSFSPDDSKVVFVRSGKTGGIFTVNVSDRAETKIASAGTTPNWKRPPLGGPN